MQSRERHLSIQGTPCGLKSLGESYKSCNYGRRHKQGTRTARRHALRPLLGHGNSTWPPLRAVRRSRTRATYTILIRHRTLDISIKRHVFISFDTCIRIRSNDHDKSNTTNQNILRFLSDTLISV